MGEDFAGTAETAPEGRDAAQLRAVYGMDPGFERELAEAWRFIEPHIAGVARELLERRAGGAVPAALVESRVDYARAKLSRPIDQAWVDRVAAEADRIAEDGLEFSTVAASMLVAQMHIHALFFALSSDPGQLERLTRATQKLAVIEFEIIARRGSRRAYRIDRQHRRGEPRDRPVHRAHRRRAARAACAGGGSGVGGGPGGDRDGRVRAQRRGAHHRL